jgi:hypothetical protein
VRQRRISGVVVPKIELGFGGGQGDGDPHGGGSAVVAAGSRGRRGGALEDREEVM